MNEWISVKDKFPADYEEVIFFAINENDTKDIMTGHRKNGFWYHCCMFYSSIILNDDFVKVTHWQPLPERPV